MELMWRAFALLLDLLNTRVSMLYLHVSSRASVQRIPTFGCDVWSKALNRVHKRGRKDPRQLSNILELVGLRLSRGVGGLQRRNLCESVGR